MIEQLPIITIAGSAGVVLGAFFVSCLSVMRHHDDDFAAIHIHDLERALDAYHSRVSRATDYIAGLRNPSGSVVKINRMLTGAE